MRSNQLRRLVVVLLTALLSGLVLIPPGAAAAPGAPGGLTPNRLDVAGIPILEWERVKAATAYDVQVSTSSGFGSLLWSTATANRRVTPTQQLPGGEIYWRVRARGANGTSPWSEAQFSRSPLAGPTPLAPADQAQLNPPEEPALLAWEPVNGATQYTLEVSTDPLFVSTTAVRSYTTKTSSYVVPDPAVATDYYWRVRASLGSGVVTEWSAARSYSMLGLDKPVLVGPDDSAQAAPLQDVVLDWEPVPGAKSYNLQVSTDRNFNSVDVQTSVVSTRYSPATTLDNDQYYWRVAPVDSVGNTVDWSSVDVWEFRRNWPHQPGLEYPQDNSMVGDPMYFEWSPARHASEYRLELATSPDFSRNSMFDDCTTVHTTYVPTVKNDCFPDSLGTYYWRVVALDGPSDVVSEVVDAEVFRFTYNPRLVTPVSPAPGATGVTVPTLTWDPLEGASQYDVTVTRTDTGAQQSARTYGTSWTPRSTLEVGATYRWQVRSVSASGRVGPALMIGSQPTFTVAAADPAAAATPEPTSPEGAVADRFPTLTWTPVPGATRYVMFVRRSGTAPWVAISGNHVYPAGEDTTSTWLAADTYQWKIEAWEGNAFLADSQAPGSFTVSPSPAVVGQRVSMGGDASADPALSCAKSLDPALPLAETQCTGLRATPVLRWDPEPGVGRYVVWISRDRQLTNVVDSFDTDQTAFIPKFSLIDSQAGSAFFWHVQPCKLPGTCRAPEAAGHAFDKISKPVQLLTPSQGATVANDVTFTWRDYLETNQDATTQGDHTGVHSIEPEVEAQRYRVQVDDDPNFQSPLDTAVVDQTTYTALSKTYPEGPLYWRVQAIDGSGNNLAWSEGPSLRTFTKRSPTVTLSSPVGGAETPGTAPLRWDPLVHAASYDVEVYKNADTIGQAGNRVFAGSSKQAALSLPQPLAVAPSAYTWRVRPRDASNLPGQWTELTSSEARFLVVGDAPLQTAPDAGSDQRSDDLLFTWNGVDGATDYRFERRLVAGGGAETVRTPGLAWAPSVVGDGLWEWRVTSVDSAGAEIGSSPWRQFTVDQTAPRVARVKPTGSVKRKSTFKAVFTETVTGVDKRTFTISRVGSRRKMSAVVRPSSSRTAATLKPVPALKKGRSYVLTLKSKIADDSGNRLETYRWTVTAK